MNSIEIGWGFLLLLANVLWYISKSTNRDLLNMQASMRLMLILWVIYARVKGVFNGNTHKPITVSTKISYYLILILKYPCTGIWIYILCVFGWVGICQSGLNLQKHSSESTTQNKKNLKLMTWTAWKKYFNVYKRLIYLNEWTGHNRLVITAATSPKGKTDRR